MEQHPYACRMLSSPPPPASWNSTPSSPPLPPSLPPSPPAPPLVRQTGTSLVQCYLAAAASRATRLLLSCQQRVRQTDIETRTVTFTMPNIGALDMQAALPLSQYAEAWVSAQAAGELPSWWPTIGRVLGWSYGDALDTTQQICGVVTLPGKTSGHTCSGCAGVACSTKDA